jgi:hypothetical protein
VLLAERNLGVAERARFRWERDRLYGTASQDEREARFDELHGRWFVNLGLDRPLHLVLAEKPVLLRLTRGCRVARAARDELADLAPAEPGDGTAPAVRIRLRPESFLDPVRLAVLLRHEFEHVSDMVDPAFGYETELPQGAGPSHDDLIRERYRAVWDASIDGRLFHRGMLGPSARDARREDFARAFPALGAALEEQFARWFEEPRPTHRAIVTYALNPPGPRTAAGRCPVCCFPTPRLDPHPERLAAGALRELRQAHPGWQPGDGLCFRCAELYEAGQALG